MGSNYYTQAYDALTDVYDELQKDLELISQEKPLPAGIEAELKTIRDLSNETFKCNYSNAKKLVESCR